MALQRILVCLTLCVVFSGALVVKADVEDLVSVVQVFRHGNRNPVNWYVNDPWKDPSYYVLGAGQLTNKGKQVHYDLGKFTRQRYGSWLPTTYSPDWFKAQTTDVDRTHMSCQSNLAGMFPPTENETWNADLPWQPIPVHPADPSLIILFPDCETFSVERTKTVLTDPWYVAFNEVFADLYTYLSNYTGNNVTTVIDVFEIYDTLLVEQEFGFQLPSWTESVFPEPMELVTSYAFLSFSYTTELKRLTAGSWLKSAIYDHFTNIFNDPTAYPKFQMWSAHDTNIASILNTFGAFDPHYPAYASTLYIELRNSSGKPVINVYHKDDTLDVFEPITISGCHFDCPLSDFATLLSDVLIDTDTWTSECSATPSTYDDEVAEAKSRIEELIKNRLG